MAKRKLPAALRTDGTRHSAAHNQLSALKAYQFQPGQPPPTKGSKRKPNRGGLTQAQRDALPDSAFAIPSRRAFPTHDQQHALWAIEDAQTATPADQAKVLAAAFWRYPHLRQVWASMRARHTQHKPTAAPISTGGRPTPRGSRQ